jgi:hypothetical protein
MAKRSYRRRQERVVSPTSRRGGCAKPLSLATTAGQEGRATSPLLLCTTPPRHHGQGGEAQRSRTLPVGETDDAIGLLKGCWSTTPWLASLEKLGHDGDNPKLRSGRSDLRNFTDIGHGAHYCMRQTPTPTTTAAGTSPPPLSAGITGESDNGLGRLSQEYSWLLQ